MAEAGVDVTTARRSNEAPAEGTAIARVSDNLRPYMAIGAAVFAVLVFAVGGWAATAELAGAVIAQGTVVVDSSVKKVQHPTGGIVGEILVRDGAKVAAGDLLLKLDDTITKVNLQIVTSQLDELAIRKARLEAERDGASLLSVPQALAARIKISSVREAVTGETTLFESRRTARAGEKAQLAERAAQLRQEINGLDAQQVAKSEEIELIAKELIGLLQLQKANLVPSLKVTTLQREKSRIGGERAQLMAAAAQAKGKIAEIELQTIQLDQDFRTEVMKELRELQAKQADLEERRVAAEDQLKRIEIRAPQAGIVHQSTVHTVGGVISQSEPLMLIVPEGDALVIETRIAPQDIDHVRTGQAAIARFTAFNQHTTPEFAGEVTRVAADLTREPQTGQAYFLARVALSEDDLKRAGALRLVPGMPAELHIRTQVRTPLSYLMKPLSDQFARAFREQ
jgi:HlyD family secretion protein